MTFSDVKNGMDLSLVLDEMAKENLKWGIVRDFIIAYIGFRDITVEYNGTLRVLFPTLEKRLFVFKDFNLMIEINERGMVIN